MGGASGSILHTYPSHLHLFWIMFVIFVQIALVRISSSIIGVKELLASINCIWLEYLKNVLQTFGLEGV